VLIFYFLDIPAVSGSPPNWLFGKTPVPASGSRRAPADGIPRPDSRTPASPAPARWLQNYVDADLKNVMCSLFAIRLVNLFIVVIKRQLEHKE